MNRSTILTLFVLFHLSWVSIAEGEQCKVSLGSPSDIAAPEYNARFFALFDESERLEKTEEGRLFKNSLNEAHNAFKLKVFEICQAEAKKSGQFAFMAVAVVSKSGVIEQYLTFPPKLEYQCYVKKYVGRSFPPPPRDHYPVGFMTFFDDPTGTPGEECVRKIFGPSYEKVFTSNPAFKRDALRRAP